MDDWDSILDPYAESLQEGYHEGQQAGLQSGYNDGWHLGKIKALEIGIELGYMQSIASEALKKLLKERESKHSTTNETGGDYSNKADPQMERRIKKLNDFLESIQSFPNPDVIFSQISSVESEESERHYNDEKNKTDIEGIEDELQAVNISSASSPVDIVGKMQRIRAKFKTILVQMKMPSLTLKKVMNGEIVTTKNGDAAINSAGNKSKQKSVTSSPQLSVYHDNEW
jgi:hypothetical protein